MTTSDDGLADADAVYRSARDRQVALAREAVAAVSDDLHRTTTHRPSVEVKLLEDDVLAIAINDGWTAPSMWATQRADAFAEVAQYFQEQLSNELRTWPVCARHDLGLHAEVRAGVAVWWCQRFEHAVAPVGSLGLSNDKRQRTRRNERKNKR